MSTIREFRSFFLRNTPVNQGVEKDREVGFPTKHKIKKIAIESGTVREYYVDVFNRFVENGVPTPEVWKKLLHSIVFLEDDIPTTTDMIAINEAIASLENTIGELNEDDRINKFFGDVNFNEEGLSVAYPTLQGMLNTLEAQDTAITNIVNIIGDNGTRDTILGDIYQLFQNLNNLDIESWYNVIRPSVEDEGRLNYVLTKQGSSDIQLTANDTIYITGATAGMEGYLNILKSSSPGVINVTFETGSQAGGILLKFDDNFDGNVLTIPGDKIARVHYSCHNFGRYAGSIVVAMTVEFVYLNRGL